MAFPKRRAGRGASFDRSGAGRCHKPPAAASSLDEIGKLIDWRTVAAILDPLYSATKGRPAWPPLSRCKALLLSIWYDLSDLKLAKALDDRASFRRFCGFSGSEATPERTALASRRASGDG